MNNTHNKTNKHKPNIPNINITTNTKQQTKDNNEIQLNKHKTIHNKQTNKQTRQLAKQRHTETHKYINTTTHKTHVATTSKYLSDANTKHKFAMVWYRVKENITYKNIKVKLNKIMQHIY